MVVCVGWATGETTIWLLGEPSPNVVKVYHDSGFGFEGVGAGSEPLIFGTGPLVSRYEVPRIESFVMTGFSLAAVSA